MKLPYSAVVPVLLVVSTAQAKTTSDELRRVSGREFLRLCALSENAQPCLQTVYTSATVNRLLDAIKNEKTFCPPKSNAFPPSDIVERVTAWLRSHPASLESPSDEALSAALVGMYPCR